jgi:GTPase SAR1 family protein
MIEQLVQSKLVLLGEMGSGKTSLVQRFVRGQYFENQVRSGATCRHAAACHRANHRPAAVALAADRSWRVTACRRLTDAHRALPAGPLQESTIGASFFTKTIPEKHVKFEIWCA